MISLHVKINHTESEDEFSIKTNENVKKFVRRLLKEFSNKHGNKGTLNDFLRKFVTICSIECTAVSGQLSLCYFFCFTR